MHPANMLRLTVLIQHHRRSVLAVLGTLMLGTGVVAFGVSPALPDAAQWPVRQVMETMNAPLVVSEPTTSNPEFLIHQSQLTRRDDSLQALLKRLGVDDREAQTFLAHDATSRMLLTGASGKLATVTRASAGRLKTLSVRWVDTNSQRISRLVVEQQEGGYQSRIEQPTPRRLEQFGSLTIRSSFYAATDQAGIPDAVAAQTVEAFSGDIDFQRDLKRGARVSLVYEVFELDGEILFTGQLLGAEIQNGKDTHQAMWFQAAGQTGEFVSLDGASQRRAYLASPLAFSRVTSSYGPRIHPVFGGQRAHKGTDYGAPAGTPIRTVADGVVSFAGRKGGYGNYVVIQHPDKAATAYAHLGRIDVRMGQRVQQGQTIGTVGSTGTATGPNLHFEYLVKGVQTNPSRIASDSSVSTVAVAQLPGFKQEAKAMREQLDMAASVALADAQ
ncbi:M23 family metallopeptidase [Hydrogenophaga aromaticivorans]|jgi:murein DD-endopeptidase MepM/ murein hydrolase activator NlpD|uniref:Murein DD-endopeptidase MepM n=2 Tax=Comamonadaceae TaxID=80864 RepID=A0A4P6WYN3_HYDPS|nr:MULTISPECIES: M23 family metallopeptidase [Hydrogenophaga]MBQ0919324.1 M23 family metallopeptidase [Hydrogenophaga aromaticivorans]MDP3425246.1 peptidoglycan DD-metalloendopeptidase family protein [Burkholderiaceae bacterium]QBM28760.1 Murein DD-endopeptidase MepM [Hydrogenophaga pseudoflava]UCU96548.1 M23 family metallopeptidase [Hydrogenophaga taeniospiralis]